MKTKMEIKINFWKMKIKKNENKKNGKQKWKIKIFFWKKMEMQESTF